MSELVRGRLIDAAGWVGTVLVLAAFAANTFGAIAAKSPLYLAMNALGAAGIGANAWVKRAYPALVVEAAWTVVSLAALVHFALRG